MGQKVNPHGLRVGVIKDWNSKWYADKKDFADLLIEDNKIRSYVKKKLYTASVSKIKIERAANNKVKVTVYTAKPGMVIGKGGSGIEVIRKELQTMINKSVMLNVFEIKRPELDAQLVAESVASALERRISFRRAMKQAMGRTMKAGAKGVKIMSAGRLGGVEMARSEKYSEGNVPLHTLRANIDYGFAEANTTYGKIGVKVWINKGEVLTKTFIEEVQEERRPRNDDRRRNNNNRSNNNNRPNNGNRPRKPDYSKKNEAANKDK